MTTTKRKFSLFVIYGGTMTSIAGDRWTASNIPSSPMRANLRSRTSMIGKSRNTKR